jgi:glycosyltransferase involved in cell wall biosynthesis
MTLSADPRTRVRVAFIGSAGIPNRYGGFEAFLEHCAPTIARDVSSVAVTCDANLYEDRTPDFHDVRRLFIGVRANGISSIPHDLVAFLRVFRDATHVVVLGVSGGPWFPFFRLACSLTGKKLLVNVDGVEWRRDKFSKWRRGMLRTFDWLAQKCAHRIVYDNPGLSSFVLPSCRAKARCIAYSGDHVLRLPDIAVNPQTALTICRIEPENNIHMLIEGALRSPLQRYTIVGNWKHSTYGQALRSRYADEKRLCLMDPVYDPEALARMRESCDVYIHGHSVGGTNPSLVEMLFYDCRLLCFDCSFNRYTASTSADYFSSADDLALQLAQSSMGPGDRMALRARYTRDAIARDYISLLN